ncbi:MAG: type VI secretion system tip protein VgrG [Polyangiaceae bacterium]|nr:type VI secretion system tip protein VgrG [Polyangiaceae bacterium]
MEHQELFSIRFPNGTVPTMNVLRWEGLEGINELGRWDLVVYTDETDATLVERTVVGASLVMSMHIAPDVVRQVSGIVVENVVLGRAEAGRMVYRLVCSPRAWLLTRRTNTRIFQDRTALDAVQAVLNEHKIAHRFSLAGKFPVRDYIVQYQESDWEFVVRLLAEEALFFWFEGPPEGGFEETLVVADSPHAYTSIAGSRVLRFRADLGGSMTLDEDMVASFEVRDMIETSVLTLRDYDFERPGLDLTTSVTAADGRISPTGGVALEAYEHHGEYEEADVDAENARSALLQMRARRRVGKGRSACRRLTSGAVFDLTDHDVTALDQPYVVTRVSHRGAVPKAADGLRVYENVFEVAPAQTAFCLPKPARRIRQTLETALVVGPSGHEIYCDRYGRIKVQFHWDREGRRNEQSSCFLRVAQGWSGSDFGHQFVPRIGMEVLVSFLGGDPDRPIVIGCIPNAHNPPQYVLPANATRSGIRTRSVPGGGGFNEIAFEDQAGNEQVYLHAQRNLDEEVGLDATSRVGRNQNQTVGKDDTLTVRGNRVETIGADQTTAVGSARSTVVGGAERSTVGSSRQVQIGGDDKLGVKGLVDVDIGGPRTTHISGRDELRVDRDRVQTIQGEHVLSVLGASRATYSGSCAINAAKGISFSLGSQKSPANSEGQLAGNLLLKGTGLIDIASEKTIRLRVGRTVLTLGPKEVRIETEKLILDSKLLQAHGEKGALNIAKEITLKGDVIKLASKDNAILELAQEAKLDGQAVKIKPGLAEEMAKREEREEQSATVETVTVTLFDLAGEPIKNAPYEVSFFGYYNEGTAADGTVKIPVFPDAQKALVRWGRPADIRKDGSDEPYEFTMEVHLETDGGEPDEALLKKLHNLGHTERDLTAAVRHYQLSMGLEPTGNPDDVRAEIEGRHGSGEPVKLVQGGE